MVLEKKTLKNVIMLWPKKNENYENYEICLIRTKQFKIIKPPFFLLRYGKKIFERKIKTNIK